MVRNPKSVAVSSYYFQRNLHTETHYHGTFNGFWGKFKEIGACKLTINYLSDVSNVLLPAHKKMQIKQALVYVMVTKVWYIFTNITNSVVHFMLKLSGSFKTKSELGSKALLGN